MNAVEIDEAITHLASTPYDEAEFPFSFLIAFGNKPTTIARLRTGACQWRRQIVRDCGVKVYQSG